MTNSERAAIATDYVMTAINKITNLRYGGGREEFVKIIGEWHKELMEEGFDDGDLIIADIVQKCVELATYPEPDVEIPF